MLYTNPTDEELALELLFASGDAVEEGLILPMPSMPIVREPEPGEVSTGEMIAKGKVKQKATGEVAHIAPQLDALRIGDEIVLPDGTKSRLQYVSPDRKRIGVGKRKGKNYVFFSMEEFTEMTGRQVAEDLKRKREESAREQDEPAPRPLQMPAKVNVPKGMSLYPHQIESVDFLERQKRGLLALEMGLGKLHPVDTKVLAPSGWRRIGDLVVGDEVIGSSGKAAAVLGVYPQGVKPSYRVHFSDGSSVEAGDEHLWTFGYRKDGRNISGEMVLTTHQIRTGATLTRPRPGGGTSTFSLAKNALYLPLLGNPVEFAPQGDLPLPAYLLGQLIANGSLAHGSVVLITNEKDWLEVRRSLHDCGVSVGAERRYPGCIRAGIPGAVKQVAQLELNVTSGDKRIPRFYMTAPPSDRIALLQGLMDGDGSISKTRNRVIYHTICRGLAEDVRELVECLGGIASVREYDRTQEEKPIEYQVRVKMPLDIPPFRVRRKLDRWKPGSHATPRRTFLRAEYVRDVESVCIKVDAEDQLYTTEHAILTHNTAVAAVSLRAPAVVVCPSLLKVNWARELAMWQPNLSVAIIGGRKPASGAVPFDVDEDLRVRRMVAAGRRAPRAPVIRKEDIAKLQREADVIVINYDVLDAHTDWILARRNQTLIADEAHYLKTMDIRWNKKTKTFEVTKGTKRAKAFFAMQQEIERLFLLTGTPILNRVKELFPLLHMVDSREWGSGFKFCQRYCAGKYEWIYVKGGGGQQKSVFKCDGRSNSQELHERIKNTYMVRYTKEQELAEFPEKRIQTKTVSLSGHWAKEYQRAANDFVRWIEEKGGPEAVAKMQLAEQLVQLGKLRAIAALGKVDAALQWIVQFFESTQRPLVVFGIHKEVFASVGRGIERINEQVRAAKKANKLPPIAREIRVATVTGSDSEAARQRAIDAFQLEGTIDVLFYSIPIATGTTLTRGQDALFLERMWRPADQNQAEDRLHRIGQKNTVFITYLDAEGTIDMKLGLLLARKSAAFSAVIDGVELDTDGAAELVFGEMFNDLGIQMTPAQIAAVRAAIDEEEVAMNPGRRDPYEDAALSGDFRSFESGMRPNAGAPMLFDDDGEYIDTFEGTEDGAPEIESASDSWYDPL